MEVSCIFFVKVVLVENFEILKFVFENLNLEILPLTSLIVSPSSKTNIFLLPRISITPFFAKVILDD